MMAIEKMTYDFSKLRGRIIEKCGSQNEFAANLGLSARTISAKMTGKNNFSMDEIVAICSLLEIDASDIGSYFFSTGLIS
ncbi:MAG: DUF739 family protein [Bacteroidales bacterium]|nr:DUF739 family protein [Bacteroidales bacterium]